MSTATSTLPRTFDVPCGGATSTVSVNDLEHLRSLRTELELLRHVKKLCGAQSLAPRLDEALHFSDPKQLELLNILADAMNPLVEETLAIIDRDFEGLRKEIVMSVINDEAKSIVQEAQEIGVAAVGQPVTTVDPSPAIASLDSPESIEQALDAAQQKLSEISGTVDELANIDSQMLDEAVSQMPVGGTETSSDPVAAIAAATEELATVLAVDQAPMTASPAMAVSMPAEARAVECKTDTMLDYEEPFGNSSVASVHSSVPSESCAPMMSSEPHRAEASSITCPSPQSTSSDSDSFGVLGGGQSCHGATVPSLSNATNEMSSERAALAVAAIEEGIRKLTAMMQFEVREQWNLARLAMQDIVVSRNASQQTLRDGQSLLSEIRRFHDEAAGAKDAADVDRREAGLFREDARRAKERAEASAAAAELAADQASKERESIRRER